MEKKLRKLKRIKPEIRLQAYYYTLIRVVACMHGDDYLKYPYMCDRLLDFCEMESDVEYKIELFPEFAKHDNKKFEWFHDRDYESRIELLNECINEVVKAKA